MRLIEWTLFEWTLCQMFSMPLSPKAHKPSTQEYPVLTPGGSMPPKNRRKKAFDPPNHPLTPPPPPARKVSETLSTNLSPTQWCMH